MWRLGMLLSGMCMAAEVTAAGGHHRPASARQRVRSPRVLPEIVAFQPLVLEACPEDGEPDFSGMEELFQVSSYEEFFGAAYAGNMDALRAMLRNPQCRHVSAQDARGRTVLHLLAAHRGPGGLETAKKFLPSRRFDAVNAPDEDGNTALHAAVDSGNVKMVRLVLQARGFVEHNRQNLAGQTAVHRAVIRGHLGALRTLVGHDKVALGLADLAGKTPLHCAIQFDRKDEATQLYCAGKKFGMNLLTPQGESALHLAAAKEWGVDLVNRLLCDPDFEHTNAFDAQGRTALMCALEHRREAIALNILRLGRTLVDSLNAQDVQRKTAAHYAQDNGLTIFLEALRQDDRFTAWGVTDRHGRAAADFIEDSVGGEETFGRLSRAAQGAGYSAS